MSPGRIHLRIQMLEWPCQVYSLGQFRGPDPNQFHQTLQRIGLVRFIEQFRSQGPSCEQ